MIGRQGAGRKASWRIAGGGCPGQGRLLEGRACSRRGVAAGRGRRREARAASLTLVRGLEAGEPGHMMMDGVSPAWRGCGRSVFCGRPPCGRGWCLIGMMMAPVAGLGSRC